MHDLTKNFPGVHLSDITYLAAYNGYTNILEYYNPNFRIFSGALMSGAINGNQLDTLAWHYENLETSIDPRHIVSRAYDAGKGGNLDIIKYLGGKLPIHDQHVQNEYYVRVLLGASEADQVDAACEILKQRGPAIAQSLAWNFIGVNNSRKFIEWAHNTGIVPRNEYSVILEGASFGGHVDLCKWLVLTANAEITAYAIDSASYNNQLDLLKFFHSHGFRSDQRRRVPGLYCRRRYATPASFEVVRWCIQHGFYKDSLIHADFIIHKQFDIVNALLDQEYVLAIDGIPALIECNNIELIHRVFSDPKARGRLLHNCLARRCYESAKLILQRGEPIEFDENNPLILRLETTDAIELCRLGLPCDPFDNEFDTDGCYTRISIPRAVFFTPGKGPVA